VMLLNHSGEDAADFADSERPQPVVSKAQPSANQHKVFQRGIPATLPQPA
jgi:hypothetical protein